ncbi:hypothetical protein OSB04_005681 [Centaurea solstitialis]|uniref:Glycerol kinase n=1 Tax=Centaurea solstitialis TaxID=347529 RepID=A0AA38TUD8_9ASTR|nr:hypothetical protein OSB04_005681 [Centaurea solstitialis]
MGCLTALAFKLGKDAPTNYAREVSITIAGAVVQWLRDSLGIISSASEIEDLSVCLYYKGPNISLELF